MAFAVAERALGKSVYVHCAHGHGRSALLLIACLLEAGQVGHWGAAAGCGGARRGGGGGAGEAGGCKGGSRRCAWERPGGGLVRR